MAAVRRYSAATPLLLALCVSGCAHVKPSPESLEVDSLKIEGTQKLTAAEVKEKILTTESPFWHRWFAVLPPVGWFDATAWQADLRRMTRYYEAHGYYQARILEEAVTPTPEGHVSILVKLSEGEPARITTVSIEGLEEVDAAIRESAVKAIGLKEGDIFLEDAWARAKSTLGAQLYEAGYAEVVVRGEAVVDADNATVTVKLICKPGLRYRFGSADDPKGLTLRHIFAAPEPGAQVPAAAIRDEVSPDIRAGEYFSDSAMKAAQARLFQMGVFAAVKVTRGAPEPETRTIPVVIDVREGPFHSARIGFGFGIDSVRNEFRVIGEYTHRNIGLARWFSKAVRLDRLSVKAKLGWAFLPNIVDVIRNDANAQNGPTFRLLTEYEVPRFLGLRTVSFQGSVQALRTLDAAFDYWGGEGKLGLKWAPRVDFSLVPSLNLSVYGLASEIPSFSAAPTAALGCPRLPSLCLVAAGELTAEFDRRDDKLEPNTGYYFGLNALGGVYNNQTLTPFLRVAPEARGYVSFGRDQRFTLAGKFKVGTLIAPGNNTPIVARFFSGGAGMRGFNQRRLSPMVAVAPEYDRVDQLTAHGYSPDQAQALLNECKTKRSPRPTQCRDFENGVAIPIGGSGLIEASLEFRWKVWGDLILAAFSDAGMVSEQALFAAQNIADLFFVAVGLGGRYRTPLGPIRLDLAFRLPVGTPQQLLQQDAQQVRIAPSGGCFVSGPNPSGGFAGAPDNRCSFHISIGESF